MGGGQSRSSKHGEDGRDKDVLRCSAELERLRERNKTLRSERKVTIANMERELYDKQAKLRHLGKSATKHIGFRGYLRIINNTSSADFAATSTKYEPGKTRPPPPPTAAAALVLRSAVMNFSIFCLFEAWLLKRMHFLSIQKHQRRLHQKGWKGVVEFYSEEIPAVQESFSKQESVLQRRVETGVQENLDLWEEYRTRTSRQEEEILALREIIENITGIADDPPGRQDDNNVGGGGVDDGSAEEDDDLIKRSEELETAEIHVGDPSPESDDDARRRQDELDDPGELSDQAGKGGGGSESPDGGSNRSNKGRNPAPSESLDASSRSKQSKASSGRKLKDRLLDVSARSGDISASSKSFGSIASDNEETKETKEKKKKRKIGKSPKKLTDPETATSHDEDAEGVTIEKKKRRGEKKETKKKEKELGDDHSLGDSSDDGDNFSIASALAANSDD